MSKEQQKRAQASVPKEAAAEQPAAENPAPIAAPKPRASRYVLGSGYKRRYLDEVK